MFMQLLLIRVNIELVIKPGLNGLLPTSSKAALP
jgi:hypothetical protein